MSRDTFLPYSKNKGERSKAVCKISYTCLRGLFKKKVADLGLPPSNSELHSLRAGGAIAAANAKVPDRLFKRQGCWRSESVKDGYVKDYMQSRLEVSRRLRLYPNIATSPPL